MQQLQLNADGTAVFPDAHPPPLRLKNMKVRNRDGQSMDVSYDEIKHRIASLCRSPGQGYLEDLDLDKVVIKTVAGIYDGITTAELDDLSSRICVSLQSLNHGYDALAGRILMSNIHKTNKHLVGSTGHTFSCKIEYINSRLPGTFAPAFLACVRSHAAELDAMIDYDRDMRYNYFSVRTMEKGYLIRVNDACVESPQDMWMRVAVGINCPRDSPSALNGDADLERIRECYDGMSVGYFTHATPTLFNAGTSYEQLSSCYLLGIDDSLEGIYRTLSNCAQISKWAGGIGVHVSNVRASGSRIKSTNGSSDGIVPMLKVFNETARYCNQSGRRKGSIAIYLEPWHADVWEFVELRRNTGAETERARDLFLALWVPDLFMRCVVEDKDWYLMSADVCPGLQDTYGKEFDELYERYVSEGKYMRCVKATKLWQHILQCQSETGVPYVLFKDSVNNKCNQKNLGVIKSSNLCAEITEFSDSSTYAVCNLASIAVNRFVTSACTGTHEEKGTRDMKQLYDFQALHRVAKLLTYNLNRIIDINFYPTPETRRSNESARPIGIGVQGVADLFFAMGIPYDDPRALDVEAAVLETIYHGALEASIELARKDGPYPRFAGSPFSEGKLQMDLWEEHQPGLGDTLSSSHQTHKERVRYSGLWDWDKVRADIRQHGARNSMLTALMPTATTSQILGNNEAFEPVHSNMFKRSTLAGEFMVVNKALMSDMMRLGLWDEDMMPNLHREDGSLQRIPGVPDWLRAIYKTVWEVPQRSIVDHAVARAPFVDQSQSMNLFFAVPNTQKQSSALINAWKRGLKTGVYYLRSLPASEATKLASLSPTPAQSTNSHVSHEIKSAEPKKPSMSMSMIEGACMLGGSGCESCSG